MLISTRRLDELEPGGRRHEKAISDADVAKEPAAFNTPVVIGHSATHRITQTKGGVLDGRVGFEGSVLQSSGRSNSGARDTRVESVCLTKHRHHLPQLSLSNDLRALQGKPLPSGPAWTVMAGYDGRGRSMTMDRVHATA